MTFVTNAPPWCCTTCRDPAVVMIDGATLYCWDHYETEMQRRRALTERIFHRVPYHLIEDWLRCGWMVAIPNGPSYHNHYGAMLEWRCACNMPRPR